MLVSSAFPLLNTTTWACPIIQNPIPVSSPLDREYTRKRFEDVKDQDLNGKQKVQVFNPLHQKWEEIHIDVIKTFQRVQLTDTHITQFLMARIDLDRVAGLTSLFPALKGEELFKEIWRIGQEPTAEEIDSLREHLYKNDCYGDDPNKPYFHSVRAYDDGNGFLSLSNRNVRFFHQVSKVFNFCRKMISDVGELCSSLNEARKKQPIKVLAIHAHGQGNAMMLKDNRYGPNFRNDWDGDTFTPHPCLQNLTPHDSIVILDSCSTGSGREFSYNMANFISNNAPPGVKVFSPDYPVIFKDFLTLTPEDLDLRFRVAGHDNERYSYDITYKIDPKDKESHCPPGKISYLAFCNKKPLFRVRRGDYIGHNIYKEIHQFYNSLKDSWSPMSREVRNYFWSKGFSNLEMGKISDLGLDLDEFIEKAKNYPEGLNPAELTDKIIEEMNGIKKEFGYVCHSQGLFRNAVGKKTVQSIKDIAIPAQFEFYNQISKRWSPVTSFDLKTFSDSGISEKQLLKISDSGMNLQDFFREVRMNKEILENIKLKQEAHSLLCQEGRFRNQGTEHPIHSPSDIQYPFIFEFFHAPSNRYLPISVNDVLFLWERKFSKEELSLFLERPEPQLRTFLQEGPNPAYQRLNNTELTTEIEKILPLGDFWMGHYYSYEGFPHGHFDADHGSHAYNYLRAQENERGRERNLLHYNICIRGRGSLSIGGRICQPDGTWS